MIQTMDVHEDQDLDGLPNVPSSRYRNSDVHDANIEDGNPANWIGKDFDDQSHQDPMFHKTVGRVPSHSDFDMIKKMMEFLEKFKKKTEIVSCSTKPIFHTYARKILDIEQHLRKHETNPNFMFMVPDMKDKYDKYWGDYDTISDYIYMTSGSFPSTSSESQLQRYLNEDPIRFDKGYDILTWWKNNEVRFPIVARMARASESTFSNGRRVITDYRINLSVVIVEALICTQDWLRKSSLPIYDYDEVHDVLADDDLAIG
ncbi:hypothetical protein Lser_V15G38641 [Lactuca serriola]